MSKPSEKKILFVLRQPAYGSHGVQEAMDLILTCAAFGQIVSVLFMDEAVTLLLKKQNTEAIELKNMLAQIKAFSIYDIHHRYFCKDSLNKLHLDIKDLTADCTQLDENGLKELMGKQDLVLSF